MQLGTFSLSLTVQDMEASRAFYAKLGFEMTGGDGESWTILVNGETVLGLFHAMFDKNILTFNPGWSGPGVEAGTFTDVREIRNDLVEQGIGVEADTTSDSSEGPASFVITDPDGNQILIDQHR